MATISEMLAQGGQYQQAGDMLRAEQIARNILQADPANVEACYLLGVSCYRLGKFAEAVEQYQRVLQFKPSAEVYNNFGSALAMQGDFDKAAVALQQGGNRCQGAPA